MALQPLDKENYVALDADDRRRDEVRQLWLHYLEVRREIQRLEAEKKAAEAELKALMRATNPDAQGAVIDGVKAFTAKPDSTFASAKFIEENPYLAAAYMVEKKVLDVDLLKKANPALYARYRAESFKVKVG